MTCFFTLSDTQIILSTFQCGFSAIQLNRSNGEIRIEGNCREKGSDLWFNAWDNDNEFNYYHGLNEEGEWTCENEIQSLVKMRKVLQKDLQNWSWAHTI